VRERNGERNERVAPLEGELLMIRRTLNNHPSTSMETQRENILLNQVVFNVLKNPNPLKDDEAFAVLDAVVLF